MFTTCVMLHNINFSPPMEGTIYGKWMLIGLASARLLATSSQLVAYLFLPDEGRSHFDGCHYALRSALLETHEEDSENGFYELRRKLVNHYYYLANLIPYQIEWLN